MDTKIKRGNTEITISGFYLILAAYCLARDFDKAFSLAEAVGKEEDLALALIERFHELGLEAILTKTGING